MAWFGVFLFLFFFFFSSLFGVLVSFIIIRLTHYLILHQILFFISSTKIPVEDSSENKISGSTTLTVFSLRSLQINFEELFGFIALLD